MIKPTEHYYVVADDAVLDGEPIVKGTQTTVREIVEVWRRGVLVERIPEHFPHLTLAQVFSALGYYSDHQAEMRESTMRHRRDKRAATTAKAQGSAQEET